MDMDDGGTTSANDTKQQRDQSSCSSNSDASPPPSSRQKLNEIENVRELLVERDEKLAAVEKEIVERDAKIAERGEELVNAELKECAEFSLETLLSLATRCTYEDASASESEFALSDIDKTKLQVSHQSMLLNHVSLQGGKLVVATEADVGFLVRLALTDAIQLVKIHHPGVELTVRTEHNLFSCQPDILVVSTAYNQLPLCAVQVKMDTTGLCVDKSMVLGQVFDYAAMLRAFGQTSPFVLLSSFSQSAVYWLNSDKTATEHAKDASLRYGCTSTAAASSPAVTAPADYERKSSKSEPRVSPLSDEERNIDSKMPTGFSTIMSRELCRSPIYEAHQLAPVLYSVILCALSTGSNERHPSKILNLAPQNTHLSIPAICMSEKEYKWGTLTTTVGQRIEGGSNNYYVIGVVGRGATSIAYHALNSMGEEVVLKLFVEATDESEDLLTLKGFQQLTKKKAKQEVKNLKELYPELKERFCCIELNNIPCVEMPFFKPVGKKDREDALDGIRLVLQNRFSREKRPLKYAEEDIRWRHVGMRVDENNNTSYYLFDVADLVAGKPDVEYFIKQLKQRMDTESIVDGMGFCHRETQG